MNVSSILIVGGGTAGWMSACLMAHRWRSKHLSIKLVESATIGTIGVGEGSTPFLRDFFEELGITESQWMPACDATYKCGIDFPGWSGSQGPASYFHPFYGEIDAPYVGDFFAHCQQARHGFDTPTLPDDYFINAYIARQNKAPIHNTGEATGIDYGYHFDARKLGLFLAEHAKKLGVVHLQDDVLSVNANDTGITGVNTKINGELIADIYIDCSGLNGLLIQQTLGQSLIDYRPYLANNAAVAIASNLPDQENVAQYPLGTYTLSKALQHGWMWSIPLTSRIGNGYVYSNQHLSPESAEQALREQLNEFDAPALHLAWKPGRIEKHWFKNCIAIGLSQGFLEPLEAPMLNLVQQTCDSFIHSIENGDSDAVKANFNSSINGLIDGTRDYLQAHYLLNTRNDSDYWIEARENTYISTELKDVIAAWDAPGRFEEGLAKHAHKLAYGRTSWYCILAGMGRFKAPTKGPIAMSSSKHKKIQYDCKAASQFYGGLHNLSTPLSNNYTSSCSTKAT
jgi:hypothetical protein